MIDSFFCAGDHVVKLVLDDRWSKLIIGKAYYHPVTRRLDLHVELSASDWLIIEGEKLCVKLFTRHGKLHEVSDIAREELIGYSASLLIDGVGADELNLPVAS
jgi:hypothetical protein